MQKLGFVPEAQNDMIFSIICEELGLTGACGVLLAVWVGDLEIDGHCHATQELLVLYWWPVSWDTF